MRKILGLAILLVGCAGPGPLGRKQETPAVASGTPVSASYPKYDAEMGYLDAHGSAKDSKATAKFQHEPENRWLTPGKTPLSTFAVDVDTASYSLIRGFLSRSELPPPEAVRIEEMINYFPYEYAAPGGQDPFALNLELADCPWDKATYLLRVGIQGRKQPEDQLPPRNLVFLLDVSGSMSGSDRLGLVQYALSRLTRNLTAKDHVAIVTYAGSSGVLLEPTSDREKILEALNRLESGGSTNGEAGIREAYELAERNFDSKGVNRVILATDGDFNVGISDHDQLVRLIEEKRKTGVFLTTLGVGQGNMNDHGLEQLADKGNGNYAFLDSQAEAEKVLVREAGATLVTIAKDVKIQVEFNPKTVKEYRLIGYENRLLAAEDFNDDTKDAGEIGSGHRVTALYQIHPRARGERARVDPLRYQQGRVDSEEVATVKLRYQPPVGAKSKLLSTNVTRDQHVDLDRASDDFRFAAAVAQFGMFLRNSKGAGSLTEVEALAAAARGQDQQGYRSQFLSLVQKARALKS